MHDIIILYNTTNLISLLFYSLTNNKLSFYALNYLSETTTVY